MPLPANKNSGSDADICSGLSPATVVEKLDSAIHRINRYLEDKFYENQLRYPLDSDLSSEKRYLTFEQLGLEHIFERNQIVIRAGWGAQKNFNFSKGYTCMF